MVQEFHSIAAQIENILREALNPHSLEVIDDSHRHIGHAGHNGKGESHFKVKIFSDMFAGKSRVERHQMVYAPLKDLLKNQVHALQIEAKASSET